MIFSTMDTIVVSPEMLTLVGTGVLSQTKWPIDPVAFIVDAGASHRPAHFRFVLSPNRSALVRDAGATRLTLLVARVACERLLGGPLELVEGTDFVLPFHLRQIALVILECNLPLSAANPFRLAKSIELLCEIIVSHRSSTLALAPPTNSVSIEQARKISIARRLIDEHWQEKLTLDVIARRCGLNQSMLSRGFRALYDCSVNEALAERRLNEASAQLMSTDLPIGVIGYRSGYLNNASFSRAFGRRFGMSPSDYRSCAFASERAAA
ncbi:MAG: AraC family transcriptional regulator [Sphingomicrobium sp.]